MYQLQHALIGKNLTLLLLDTKEMLSWMKFPYSPKPLLEISNKFQYNSIRCTLCPVHELTRETKEIDCGKCDSYTRCCRNFATTHTVGVGETLQSLIHWMYQKFCGHLYTGRRRNSVSTLTLDIAEICDHWYTGCDRNSATFYKWMWQKFCNDSYTGCCRNSATTHTLDVAEILRPLIPWM